MTKFGIIIHYGLYSYYAYDNIHSAKKRNIQNGSEWYYGRLIDNNKYRPISGNIFTKKHHIEKHKNINYFDNLNEILVDKSKIRDWIKLCKKIGASYIILTSKHHDGVCLWNTNTTNRKSKLDICKIFKEECEKENMKWGFYYSWFEFDKSFTVKYFFEYCVPQLKELIEYEPKYMWFDGHWKITQKNIMTNIKCFIEDIRKRNIIINDRVSGVELLHTDYRVFSDRFIPDKKLNIKWQHVNTIGYSWGFNSEQKDNDYKTGEDIVNMYNKVNNKGGELLLNIGPDINGNIHTKEQVALEYFGKNRFT